MAAKRSSFEITIVRFIMNCQPPPSNTCAHVINQNHFEMNPLIRNDSNQNHMGENFLVCAVRDHVECLKAWLEKNPSLLTYKNVWRENVFHMICANRSVKCLEYLVNYLNGLDHPIPFSKEDMKRYDGKTPLHLASLHPNNDIHLLIAKHREILGTGNIILVDEQDEEGCTALHFIGDSEFFCLWLLENDADPYIKNRDGVTPISKQNIQINISIIQMMKTYAETRMCIKEPCVE